MFFIYVQSMDISGAFYGDNVAINISRLMINGYEEIEILSSKTRNRKHPRLPQPEGDKTGRRPRQVDRTADLDAPKVRPEGATQGWRASRHLTPTVTNCKLSQLDEVQ